MRAEASAAPHDARRARQGTVTDEEPTLPPWLRALLDRRAYPHPADDLELHETHISWVILAGPFAYKIKKPVDLGFLDFTTIERRAADCAEEVRLNRRLCPDVYLGVVDIVERDGGHFVSGPGRTVEPAVQMRRLPEAGMLPALLAHDAVGPELVQRLARQVAEFHASVATGFGVDEKGSPATIHANWEENFIQIAPFVGRTLSLTTRNQIYDFVEAFLTEQHGLLERRVAKGRIRDGHGDLHAASICVEGDRILIFDCLEFAPRFRCSDVAAEVAFLAMDFDHYGRADLEAAFVAEYVRCSRDDELTVLLNFYKAYRACVRGKVASLRLNESGLSVEDQTAITAEARSYFDLACQYAVGWYEPATPPNEDSPRSQS